MAGPSLSAAIAEIKANPGKFYVYLLLRPNNVPFYVGYARVRTWNRQRIEEHVRFFGSNEIKHRIIKKICAAGGCVNYSIDSWHTSIEAAHSREVELISTFGRLDKKTGLLANLTDGGEGTANISDRHVAAIKRANTGRKWSDEARTKFSQKCRGRRRSPGAIEKTRVKNTGKKRSLSAIEVTRQKHLGMKRSDEFCVRQSKSRKGRRPPTIRPCEIDGTVYQTLSAAAQALSTRPSTVFHWIRRGVRGARYLGPKINLKRN